MSNPDDLKYTEDHEWTRIEDDTATIGITQFAVDQLGDITLVELPEAGTDLKQGDTFGVVESVKTVSDLYAPISGSVIEINEELEDAPELVNESPYGKGWMLKIRPADPAEEEELMDAAAYDDFTASQDH